MNEKIDFVILWVDGNDKEWQKEKNKYSPKKIEDGVNGEARFRDWENLKYFFRGVEKYAPWVNNVYFITWGHLPSWLNTKNSKLKIINHKDYIPEKYLPTFNCNVIELNINRIKSLSENFVLFNDDMMITNDITPDDFFQNGIPKDTYSEVNWDYSNEDPTFASMLLNNYSILGKYYNKRKEVILHPTKFLNYRYGFSRNIRTIKNTICSSRFLGINNPHLAQPFKKSCFQKLWDLEPELLNEVSTHKFRTKEDITEYLIRYLNLFNRNFIPRDYKLGKYFAIKDDNSELLNTIKNNKYKIICMNDCGKITDFEKTKAEIIDAFETILSEKSSFEK